MYALEIRNLSGEWERFGRPYADRAAAEWDAARWRQLFDCRYDPFRVVFVPVRVAGHQ